MKRERLVTPQEKRALAKRAKALDVSVGELLRRSAQGLGAGADEATLSVLAREVQTAVKESRAALREALVEAQATLSLRSPKRKARGARCFVSWSYSSRGQLRSQDARGDK